MSRAGSTTWRNDDDVVIRRCAVTWILAQQMDLTEFTLSKSSQDKYVRDLSVDPVEPD